MRKDLKNVDGHKVRTGKLISQGGHASCKSVTDSIAWDTLKETELSNLFEVTLVVNSNQVKWLRDEAFTKVCVYVNSEKELMEVYDKARMAGLHTCLVEDSGKTEFGGEETPTCIAIGPDSDEKLKPITGHLKLF